jgi:hypothetical protein
VALEYFDQMIQHPEVHRHFRKHFLDEVRSFLDRDTEVRSLLVRNVAMEPKYN